MLDHLWTQAHFRSDELPDAKTRLLVPGVFDGTQLFEVEADGGIEQGIFRDQNRIGGIAKTLADVMHDDTELLEHVFVDVRHHGWSKVIMLQVCNSRRFRSRLGRRFSLEGLEKCDRAN